MMSMIRNSFSKVAMPIARRSISNSSKSNNAAVAMGHEASMSGSSTSSSTSGRAFKAVAYTVIGSTAVVAGFSHLLKDEVVYWTPNVRK